MKTLKNQSERKEDNELFISERFPFIQGDICISKKNICISKKNICISKKNICISKKNIYIYI